MDKNKDLDKYYRYTWIKIKIWINTTDNVSLRVSFN